LPSGYFAEPRTKLGGSVEADVTDCAYSVPIPEAGLPSGIVGQPAVTMPAVFPDEIEVLVFSTSEGPTLVAAIELVSPGNKDREEARPTFAAKCVTYLSQGIGLIVVDIVTSRQANLHDEMIQLLRQPEAFLFPGTAPLYAVAYRPTRSRTADQIEMWFA